MVLVCESMRDTVTLYSLQISLFQPERKGHCVLRFFLFLAMARLAGEKSKGAVERLKPFQLPHPKGIHFR